jgi:hypothetical protein
MADLWYIEDNGREMGPLGFFFLKVMAEERKIGPATLVRPEGGPWRAAGAVDGLFPGRFETGAPPAAARPRTAPPHPRDNSSAGSGGGFARAGGWGVIILFLMLLRVGCNEFRTSRSTWKPPSVPPPDVRFHDPRWGQAEEDLPPEVRRALEGVKRVQRPGEADPHEEWRKLLDEIAKEQAQNPGEVNPEALRKLQEAFRKAQRKPPGWDERPAPPEKLPAPPEDR